mgnify:CR=1 FL=1
MSTTLKEWLLKTIAELEEERDATPGVVNEDADKALAAMKRALASLTAEPDYYVVVTSVGVWQSFCKTKAEAEFIVSKPFNPGYSILEIYTAPPTPVAVPLAIHDEDFEKALSVLNDTLDDCGDSERGLLLALDKAGIEVRIDACRAAMLQGAEQTNYRAIVERIAEIVHGKVTDIDLLTVTVKSMKDIMQGKASLRDDIRRQHAEWSQSTFGKVGPVGPLKHLSKEALEAAAEPGDLSEWADMQFLLWDAQRNAGITDEQITQALIDKLKVNKDRQWPEPKDGEPRLHIKAASQQKEKAKPKK